MQITKYLLSLSLICCILQWKKLSDKLHSISANHDFVFGLLHGMFRPNNARIARNSPKAGDLQWTDLSGTFKQISASVATSYNGTGDIFALKYSGSLYKWNGSNLMEASKARGRFHDLTPEKIPAVGTHGDDILFHKISAGFDSMWALSQSRKVVYDCKFPCKGKFEIVNLKGKPHKKIKHISLGYKYGWILFDDGQLYRAEYPFKEKLHTMNLSGVEHKGVVVEASKIDD